MSQLNPLISRATLSSPIGPVQIEATDAAICRVHIDDSVSEFGEPNPMIQEALDQLAAWFQGRLQEFDLPLEPLMTPRGEAHRAAIRDIGYGSTASYGELARSLGSSPRAVGQACRRNPLPIIIPCHRVVGTGGSIGHYSAGEGMKTKLWLLQHEERTG